MKNVWVLENLPRFRGCIPNPTPLHEFAQFLGCETPLPHPAITCLSAWIYPGIMGYVMHFLTPHPCLRTCIPFTHFSLGPSLKNIGCAHPLWVRPCLHYDLIFIDAVSYGMKPEVRSRMRALDWARTDIKIAQLNDSSHSPYILSSIFRIFNGLRYRHKQTLSIYYNI